MLLIVCPCLESFQHSNPPLLLSTQAIKRILVASNGMAAAKVMMSMRQWAHMEVAVGPESRGKSVRPPNVSPPHNWVPAKIIIMNPSNFTQKFSSASPNKKSFCAVRVKACDKTLSCGFEDDWDRDGVRCYTEQTGSQHRQYIKVREMKVLMYSQLLCNMICVVFDGTWKTHVLLPVPEVFC